MNKKHFKWFIGLMAFLTLAVGYLMWDHFRPVSLQEKKPISMMASKRVIIKESTPVIYEKEYLRSQQRCISECEFKTDLVGKSLEEIKKSYAEKHGFSVRYSEGQLFIQQKINDFSPADKKKCRLREYQGRLAVYEGPVAGEDLLLWVSKIRMDKLPRHVQQAVREGKYEFRSQEELNDALENLDEYLP